MVEPKEPLQVFPPVGLPSFPNKDRILGTIYGNCIGDAIGLLTEFMTKKEAKEHYDEHRGSLSYEHKVKDMHRIRWKDGDWTDDSDQMVLIMDSIVDSNGRIDYRDYGKKLSYWTRVGFPELGDYVGMGIGTTTDKVMKHPMYKTDPHRASEDVWLASGKRAAPNGGVMRTSILGVYQHDCLHKVMANAVDICRVTHHDHKCRASVIAVTTSIALMLRGEYITRAGDPDVDKIIEESYKLACTAFIGLPDQQAQCKELKKFMHSKLSDLKLDEEDKIGFTYKAMGAAFWALRQNDFYAAIEKIIFEGGDADSNCAVAGSLIGCKVGLSKLPENWLNGLVHKKWLDAKIKRFVDLMFQDGLSGGEPSQPGAK